jgi:hypothetical protein
MRERRAKVVNQGIRNAVGQFRQEYQMEEAQVNGMDNPVVEQSAQYLWPMLDKQYPIMMDDDIEAHLEALSTMTQDESEDSIVRRIAILRQNQFFQWLSGKQQAVAAQPEPPATGGGGGGGGGGGLAPPPVQSPSQVGGTVTAEAMSTPRSEIQALTEAAQGAV